MIPKIPDGYSNFSNDEKIRIMKSFLSCVSNGKACDLHLHTCASDGTEKPASIVRKAIENKLAYFSVTDHDSIDSVYDVIEVMDRLCDIGMDCPTFIPGIELSAEDDGEIHILGYFPYGGFEKMEKFISSQRQRRHLRNIKMCKLLTEEGMPVSIEELKSQGSKVVGRLHAANVLIQKGYVNNVKEAFDNWIGYDRPCYAKRVKTTAEEAICAIEQAGGISVLAHPFLYGWTGGKQTVSPLLIQKLEKLKSHGLSGVEAFHGEATQGQALETYTAALISGLVPTRGSDYHGENKKSIEMFSADIDFKRKKEEIIRSAIVEVKGKYLLVTNTQDPDKGKWKFPYIINGEEESTENSFVYLPDNNKLKISCKQFYNAAFFENDNERLILSSFKCTAENPEKVLSKAREAGLFTLSEISGMDLYVTDGIIADKLREITFEQE